MANSVSPKLASVMVASICILVVVAAPYAEAAMTCGQIAGGMASCLTYLQGTAPLGSPCCGGVKSLVSAATTPADRQTACNCLKQLATGTAGIKPNLATTLPSKCGVNIGYPISLSVDCSKVK